MSQLKDWIPFFSQLVWPIFLIAILVIFKDQVLQVFRRIEKAIDEGRSVQVGDWLKIGEKTSIGELSSRRETEVADKIDLSIESIGGYCDFVEKGSMAVLGKLKEQLRNSATQRIDVLLLTYNLTYSTKLLSNYIATLGIRFVVFQDNGKFQGWVDAGLFNSQLPTRDENWQYSQLRAELIGIRQDSVSPDASAIAVLKAMDKANIENMAVVENARFRFIANRENILSKLLTAAILKE